MGIRRVTDLTNSIDDLYAMGRSYPHKLPHDHHPKVKGQTFEQPDPKQQRVQDPQDRAASTGDVKAAWLRGRALPPHFDRSGPSGRRYNRRSEEG